MWSVMENGELVPLSVLNERAARAKCDELLRRHDLQRTTGWSTRSVRITGAVASWRFKTLCIQTG